MHEEGTRQTPIQRTIGKAAIPIRSLTATSLSDGHDGSFPIIEVNSLLREDEQKNWTIPAPQRLTYKEKRFQIKNF